MKLFYKLILGFLLVALLISVTGELAVNVSEEAFLDAFVESSIAIATEIMKDLDRNIDSKINLFHAYSKDLLLQKMVIESNQDFEKLVNMQEYIDNIDNEWISTPKKEITPFMQGLINNVLSNKLKEKIGFFEGQYGYKIFPEVFITNKYGANVAQTGKTSDYRQDDEKWWQSSKKNGVYVQDVEYDVSADVYSTDIGIRIDDKKGNFIGVIKIVVNIEDLRKSIIKTKAKRGHKEHEIMEIALVTKAWDVIISTGDNTPMLIKRALYLIEDNLLHKAKVNEVIFEDDLIITHVHSRGYRDYKGFDWNLLIIHSKDEIFAPGIKLRNHIRLISSGVAIFGILIGFLISSSIRKNLQKLIETAVKIGKGDMDVKIDVRTKDEIGQLADAFNLMIGDLAETTVSRNKLTEEVIERKRVEVEVQQKQQELEKTNIEIERDRQDLANILNEVSEFIQDVTVNMDTSFRFPNSTLKRCYELKNCDKKECPCYGKEPMRCWQIAGTFCGGEVQGQFAEKITYCSDCEVLKSATDDSVSKIGEQFNNMMYMLDKTNKELKNANAELKSTQFHIIQQEKMASIGQLAAGVAHEINNPVGFISSNLSTLMKYNKRLIEFIKELTEATDKLDVDGTADRLKEMRKQLKIDYIIEDVEPLISESLEGTERVKVIVQNLKSFSRVDEAEHKMADMNECMENTLNIIWNELKYKSTVKKDYGDIPLTKCYPQQLNQVFMNLLVNAGQAIEEQGDISIKTWNGDGLIYISISDTGSGIPKDKLGKIFDPFFTTKEVGKGTGLGLSITYDIVSKHDGDITVDSEVGKGTTFTVVLPVVEAK